MPIDTCDDDVAEMIGENEDPGHRMWRMAQDGLEDVDVDVPVDYLPTLQADLEVALAAVLEAKAIGQDPREALKAALRARRC